jgi:hypothetical protein
MDEQSYIIRVYRSAIHRGSARYNRDAIALDGIVESPASGEHMSFHNAEELWAILVSNTELGLNTKRLSRRRGKR